MVFALYGVLILVRLRRGSDAIELSRLELGRRPLLSWRLLALFPDRLGAQRRGHCRVCWPSVVFPGQAGSSVGTAC